MNRLIIGLGLFAGVASCSIRPKFSWWGSHLIRCFVYDVSQEW